MRDVLSETFVRGQALPFRCRGRGKGVGISLSVHVWQVCGSMTVAWLLTMTTKEGRIAAPHLCIGKERRRA